MAISVGDAVVRITGDTGSLDKTIGGLGGKMKSGLGGAAKVAGIGIAGLAVAAVGLGVKATKMAADFEGGMREVNTMLGLSEEEFAKLQQDVLDLSAETGTASGELSEALYQIVSAGVPASQALDVLKSSAIGAVAGVTDVGTAADGVTTIMNAFKIPASESTRILDTMFATVKGGKTTMEELSASIYNVAPLAASAGVSFEEVAGAIATVTKQGVPTAQATTQLRAAIQAIIKPSADMKEALTALGYSSGEALIQEQGLSGALNTLTMSAGGSNEILGKMFGSVEGLQAVLSLTGENAGTFSEDIANAMNSAGAATEAYDEINKGSARQFEILQKKVEALLGELGGKLLPLLDPLIDAFMELVDSLPMDEVAELIKMLLPPLVKLFKDLLKAVPLDVMLKFVMAVMEPLLGILEAILPILEPILELFGGLLKLLTPVIEILGRVLEYVFKILGSGITSVLSTVSSWFGLGKARKFEMPSFQGYEGVIAPGLPTGTPIPAVVHAGEYIGQGSGRGTVVVNVYNAGSVVTEHNLVNSVRKGLLMTQDRNYSTGIA